jgi:hypothetical protein
VCVYLGLGRCARASVRGIIHSSMTPEGSRAGKSAGVAGVFAGSEAECAERVEQSVRVLEVHVVPSYARLTVQCVG